MRSLVPAPQGAVDRTAYRGRNVMERAFHGFEVWRWLATRYDKHAIFYRGGLVLAAVLLWLTDVFTLSGGARPCTGPSSRCGPGQRSSSRICASLWWSPAAGVR